MLRLVDYQLDNFAELDGEILNVGGGKDFSLSLLETTQLCETITRKSTLIKPVLEERPGDIPIFITDSSKVIEKTGWKPTIKPEETIQDIYKWIIENEALLRPILS